MRNNIYIPILSLVSMFCAKPLAAQDTDSIEVQLHEVIVESNAKRYTTTKVENAHLITSAELKRAACCNLGESFTTNPSVDVSYNDAATGARQIRLLGLSGSYVQMLTENIPNLRIAAAPYGLGYIAGPWMQSIQVSKGASSVKNGYESITGQINIEIKKPQADRQYSANGYVDHLGKVEANADANWHLNPSLSTGLLVHFENASGRHDSNNDGFIDMPRINQLAVMDRWAWMGTNYVFQAGVKYLDEKRHSGQDTHHHNLSQPYKIGIETHRWEGFTKNAYIFDHDNDGNIALILSGSIHDQNANYGMRLYDINQKNLYASLMFERKWSDLHAISAGLSLNYDNIAQHLLSDNHEDPLPSAANEIESVTGAYVQYTLDVDKKLLLMGGIRYDYSSRYHSMVTPRMHLRYTPIQFLSVHASAGCGYRTPHPLAENNYLLASGRQIVIADNLKQEKAWNYGVGATVNIPLSSRTIDLSAEYYYTDFKRQLVIDYDSDPHQLIFDNLTGKSFSHTLQLEATCPITSELTATAAWRLNRVKYNIKDNLVDKPLQPRYKWLTTISYAPMMGIWQFDVTLAVNGGGRMPTPYLLDNGQLSWPERFKAFPQLNAQITRDFRHFSIYVGAENITGYRQPSPVISADDPFGSNFDATMIYGPLHGTIVYAGFRYSFTQY